MKRENTRQMQSSDHRNLNFVTIRNYHVRAQWQARVSPECTVWAFYNNGHNLYLDQFHQSAVVFYRNRWLRLPESLFWFRSILVSPMTKYLLFQQSEHDVRGNARITISNTAVQSFVIPPKHILYVAVSECVTVATSHLQFQPLPTHLVPRV